MTREFLLRPHHTYHIATLISGWEEYSSIAENEISVINRYTLPDQIKHHDKYYYDLVGERPTRPLSKIDLKTGALGEFARRENKIMKRFLNASDQDTVKFICVGKDDICQAAAIGKHCNNRESANYEKERILMMKEMFLSDQIGRMDIYNVEDVMSMYALTTFGLLRNMLWLKTAEAEMLSEFTGFSRWFELGGILGR